MSGNNLVSLIVGVDNARTMTTVSVTRIIVSSLSLEAESDSSCPNLLLISLLCPGNYHDSRCCSMLSVSDLSLHVLLPPVTNLSL